MSGTRSSAGKRATLLSGVVAFAGSLFVSPGSSAAEPFVVDRVIAVVNDQIILRSDLQKELSLIHI